METAIISRKTDAKAYLRLPYARVLTPEESGGYAAEMLEFPGCFAEGETAEEAIHNLEEVAESWIEAAQEQGMDIPEPTANQPYAGRIALRLPRDLHRLAVRKAQRDGTSLNQYLVTAIAAWLGADNLLEKMLSKAQRVHMSMNFIQVSNPTLNYTYAPYITSGYSTVVNAAGEECILATTGATKNISVTEGIGASSITHGTASMITTGIGAIGQSSWAVDLGWKFPEKAGERTKEHYGR